VEIEMKDNIFVKNTTLQKIEIERDDILLEMDDNKKFVALWFCNASELIKKRQSQFYCTILWRSKI
jgi:hypothetical protein